MELFQVVLFAVCLTTLHVTTAVKVIFGHEDQSQNKFNNWDFEQDPTRRDWTIGGCKATKVAGGKTGRSSLKITNRGSKDSGLKQTVTGLKTGTSYYVSFFIKMTTDVPNGYALFSIMCRHGSSGGGIAKLPYQRLAEYSILKWRHIGGDFTSDGSTASCWVRVIPASVEYQVDTASFTELTKRTVRYYNDQIKLHRTSPLTVKGTLPSGCSRGNVRVELVRPEFEFGMALNAMWFGGPSSTSDNYRNFVFKYFNCAVFANDMKWRPMEGTKGSVNYKRLDKAIGLLRGHNVTVRGHTILWAVMETNPFWLLGMKDNNAIKWEALRREGDIIRHFGLNISEWDVNNECLHGHWFSGHTDDKDFLRTVFKKCHEANPKAKCYLNDYEIVRNGIMTSAMADLGEYLQLSGVRCDGIGIQSHLRRMPFVAERLQKRLEIAGRLAGVPITITEFTAHSRDMKVRADYAELALRIYMANPKVKAVLFWTVGPQFGSFANDYYLVEGNNFTPNEAGRRVLNLIYNEWRTVVSFSARKSSFSHTIPYAFRGNFKVTVTCGKKKTVKTFYLGKGPTTFQL